MSRHRPELFLHEQLGLARHADAPDWGTSTIVTPWMLYTIYGDTKVLEDNYATMKTYLEYFQSKESGGVVKYAGLGDWMRPAAPTSRTSRAPSTCTTRA